MLFDVLSFPHVPYVFLYMTGLVAVVIATERRGSEQLVVPLTVPLSPAPGEPPRRAAEEPLLRLR